MNLQKRLAFTLAAAALFGLTAVAASAATITKGTFTLPAQAYWNDNLLQPGEYSLSLDRSATGAELVTVRGEGMAAVILVQVASQASSGHSCLKADEVDGTYVIRELDAGTSTGSYQFGVSKAARNLTLRGAAGRPVTVAVAAAGM